MGLHTGEPHIGEEGYLGLDVVARGAHLAAGHGGQILVSETTRALLGNQLPEGVAVHDLGQQNLKDIQHEHIYELSIDGRPLAEAAEDTKPQSRQEDMAADSRNASRPTSRASSRRRSARRRRRVRRRSCRRRCRRTSRSAALRSASGSTC